MDKITMYLSRIGYLIALVTFLILSRGSNGILAPCHSYLEEEEGFIASPDSAQRLYSDLECIFDIARSSLDQCGIRLTFEEFKLEGQDIDGFCKKDWLSIDSCVPEGGSRFCGDLAPVSYEYPFQQGAEAFRLIFCSGNYTREKRFRIRYKLLTECNNGLNLYWDPPVSFIPGVKPKETPCFTQVTEKKGTINTPYFPRYYPNDMDCIYEFVRESPYICGIRMKTISFELDNAIVDENACLDFFHMPGCGFLCGSLRYIWTAKFQPGATSLKFHFHSDENETRQGFQIAFEQIYNC